MNPSLCPCGSLLSYNDCCGRLHSGATKAITPVQLMRSRYAAYVVGAGEYLLRSWADETRPDDSAAQMRSSALQTEWVQLEILDELTKDDEGWVEFKAWHRQGAQLAVLHERSRFIYRHGDWFYLDGVFPAANATKAGRNDPCPCGSGKKFKRCCG